MNSKLKNRLSKYYINWRGWRTDRKIVVFESDDWGSIRMPSKEVYQKCLKAGYRVNHISYEKYDSLASEDDLELLFDLLTSFEDTHGNHPVITANALVANPDFQKIRKSNFEEYHYESIEDTFHRYPKHSNCLHLWKAGMKEGVFFLQSHGREHLNVSMFMDALKSGDEDARFGLEHEMPGSIPKGNAKGGNKYVEALRYVEEEDKMRKLAIVKEGLELFETLFGYKSESFIPPNYIWSSDFDKSVAELGVRYYQGNRKMKEPLKDGSVKLKSHYLGEQNSFGQTFLVRNSMFEPAMFNLKVNDWVSKCLRDIEIAFKMKKPAIICTHRLNYVGFLDERNRDENLRLLNELIGSILNKWPNVEFLTSKDLGRIISEKS